MKSILASQLTAGMGSSSATTLIKFHTRWMEVMQQIPRSLSPRLAGIRLYNHHQLAAWFAEGRTCFADFLPVLSISSLAWLIFCPNTQENTLMFIHPASANYCLVLIRVIRVLESNPVGPGERHEYTLNRSLIHYRTRIHTHTHPPRGNLESLISPMFMF